MKELAGKAAIVGIGTTDFRADYARRDIVRTARDLSIEAFREAIEESGVAPSEIDGIVVPAAPGAEEPSQALFDALGVRPRWVEWGKATLPAAVAALAEGKCNTVAIVYASAQRSVAYKYGGASANSLMYRSYYYYHPWGFSSQGAIWAMATKRYQLAYGATEAQLGAVPVAFRRHAIANDRAVMKKPMSIEDYLAARYVCRPLRLYDYCMVNDGAIVLIVKRVPEARGSKKTPVVVAGFGEAKGEDIDQLRAIAMDHLYDPISRSSRDAFQGAGMTPKDVRHFQVYDAFSINLPIALEGSGFCPRGEGLNYIQGGRIEIGGELPCNTSGGMLSEAYMHGWNHTVEAVRQLRHEAGARQVPGLEASMYAQLTSGTSWSTILRRAA